MCKVATSAQTHEPQKQNSPNSFGSGAFFDGHNSRAGQFLDEQVPEIGLHSLRTVNLKSIVHFSALFYTIRTLTITNGAVTTFSSFRSSDLSQSI
jgi:hypothetical protein